MSQGRPADRKAKLRKRSDAKSWVYSRLIRIARLPKSKQQGWRKLSSLLTLRAHRHRNSTLAWLK